MQQILYNYFFLFILPFVLGFVLRLIIRKFRQSYILTICFILFAILMWGIPAIIPSYRSESNSIITIMVSSLAAGTLAAGLIIRIGIINVKHNRK